MTIGIVGLPHYFPDGFFIDTTMDKKYVVYQHVTPDGMYYFGQTQNVERRWSNNGAEYKRTALQPYIEKFGWDNIQHIVLFRDQTKEDALFIEDFLIETAREDGVCINKQRSGLVSKKEGYNQDRKQKYYEQNKDRIRERQREYNREYYEQNKDKRKDYLEQNKVKIRKQRQQRYQKNREKELEQRRQRYQKNREKELEHQREYRQQNREKEREYQREYHQKNREKRLEQRRQRYQRKKEKKQLQPDGCLPLW